ncbi:hypothetical protein PSYMO_33722, partial [Pseudomonas amygdali pv. mori str. 301020]
CVLLQSQSVSSQILILNGLCVALSLFILMIGILIERSFEKA